MTGRTSNFNQFQSIDLSLASVISQYIDTLDYITSRIAFISGVSPQRLGAINTNELVGNVDRAVTQSALITEYLFDSHDEVKRRFYTALIEAAKIAYRDGLVTQYVLDDMGIEILKLEEFALENSDFNVYMSNSNKDLGLVEQLKQLSQVALQTDKADLSTIIETIVNDTPKDIIRTLQKSEAAKYARIEEEQKANREVQMQQSQIQEKMHSEAMQLEQQKLQLDQYKIDTDNQTKIQVAQINVYARQDELDQDQNGIPDPIELAKQSLSERESYSNAFREDLKLKLDKDKHDKEVSLKEKEMNNKVMLENKKLEAIKIQNKNQIDLANKKAKLDKELAEKKLAIEKIKARSKPKSK